MLAQSLCCLKMSSTNNHVLVTGGAGFIGTHTCVELLQAGFVITVIDNLDNSCEASLERVREITGCADGALKLIVVDLLNMKALDAVFANGPFCCCIHFAGLKAVGESVKLPIQYYANNVTGTLNLLHCCDKYNLHNFVFSSSATVYGDPDFVPITESHPLRSTNPYGKTKLFIEEILRDLDQSNGGTWSIAILRYFNPIGAHPSGRIGEDPKGIPNNLVPFIAQVAIGKRDKLSVFGSDYSTPDGTGQRDYLHVVDLAKAHVCAAKKVTENKGMGAVAYNLGSGQSTSVLEMLKAFEKACGHELKYKFEDRRAGDIAECFADASFAKQELGWEAMESIDKCCEDGWRWQMNNPNGFREEGEEDTGERKADVFKTYPVK